MTRSNEYMDILKKKYIHYINSCLDIKKVTFNSDLEVDNSCFSLAGTLIESDSFFYPAAIGFDVGCGVGVYKIYGMDLNKVDFSTESVFGIDIQNAKSRCGVSVGGDYIELKKRILFQKMGWIEQGNHFVEFLTNEKDEIFVIVHSGLNEDTKDFFAYQFVSLYKKYVGNLDGDNGYKLKIPIKSSDFKDYYACCEMARRNSYYNRKYIANRIAKNGGGICREIVDTCHEFVEYIEGTLVHSNGVQALKRKNNKNVGVLLSQADNYNYVLSFSDNTKYFNHGTKLMTYRSGREYGAADEVFRVEQGGNVPKKQIKRLKKMYSCKNVGGEYVYSVY